MFEKIHAFVLGEPFLLNIFNTFYPPVEKQLDRLKETLSENTYLNIEELLNKIASVSLILLSIYIVYSVLLFIFSFLFKLRFRIKILISIALSLPIFLLFYAIFAYINLK